MREIIFFNFYLKKTRLAIQEKNRCLLKDGTSRLVIFLSQIESFKGLFTFVGTQFRRCVWRDVYLEGYK